MKRSVGTSRRCFRHLDRPFVVLFGLGPLDLFGIAAAAAVLIVLTNPLFGLIGGAGVGLLVQRLKEGRPRGYAFTLLYRSGLIVLVPAAMRPPGLVLPPGLGVRDKVLRFSAVSGEEDGCSEEARFWLGSRSERTTS